MKKTFQARVKFSTFNQIDQCCIRFDMNQSSYIGSRNVVAMDSLENVGVVTGREYRPGKPDECESRKAKYFT